MLKYQTPPPRFSPAMVRKKAAQPQTPYPRQMHPAPAATQPPVICAVPTARG